MPSLLEMYAAPAMHKKKGREANTVAITAARPGQHGTIPTTNVRFRGQELVIAVCDPEAVLQPG